MVRLARKKPDRARAGGAAEDEEDAALSAFDSFYRGAATAGIPDSPTGMTSGDC